MAIGTTTALLIGAGVSAGSSIYSAKKSQQISNNQFALSQQLSQEQFAASQLLSQEQFAASMEMSAAQFNASQLAAAEQFNANMAFQVNSFKIQNTTSADIAEANAGSVLAKADAQSQLIETTALLNQTAYLQQAESVRGLAEINIKSMQKESTENLRKLDEAQEVVEDTVAANIGASGVRNEGSVALFAQELASENDAQYTYLDEAYQSQVQKAQGEAESTYNYYKSQASNVYTIAQAEIKSIRDSAKAEHEAYLAAAKAYDDAAAAFEAQQAALAVEAETVGAPSGGGSSSASSAGTDKAPVVEEPPTYRIDRIGGGKSFEVTEEYLEFYAGRDNQYALSSGAASVLNTNRETAATEAGLKEWDFYTAPSLFSDN